MSVEQHKPSPLTLDGIAELARETMMQEGKHPPTLIVDGTFRTGVIELSDFGRSHDERIQQLATLGYELATHKQAGQLQQAFLITEAWMIPATDGIWPDLPPSQDANRAEVLIISQFDAHTLEGMYILYELKRTADGHLLELAELPPGDSGRTQTDNRLLTAFALGFHMGEMGTSRT